MNKKALLEAALFVSDKPLSLDRISAMNRYRIEGRTEKFDRTIAERPPGL